MIDFSISWLPFLTVAVANFFGSWLYYSPMSPLFKVWARNVGMDPENKTMTEDQKKAMPRLMGGAVVASLLIAYVFQVLVQSLQLETFADGMILGVVAWIGFAVTQSLNTQFEGRKPVVLVINNILYVITYAVFGGVFAVWK